MKKFIPLSLFLLFFGSFLAAQDENNRTAINLYLTKSEYRGDHGSGIWDLNRNFNLGAALSIQQYFNPWLDFGLQAGYGRYNFDPYFSGRKYEAFAFINYKMDNGYIFSEKSKLSPFFVSGIGLAGYHSGSINKQGLDVIIPLGAGLKFRLSENLAFEYKYLIHFTNRDDRDGLSLPKSRNDIYGQHFCGMSFSFGSVDTDRDGVSDKKDLCPFTPLGIMVDKNGCPLDTDADGVPDYLDECPNVAGSKLLNGCPDSDGDGVSDLKDQCPNTRDGVKVNSSGCPKDFDNDGVPDYLDKCPDVPGLSQFNGCPDSDGDGVPDNTDRCPNTRGLPEFHGCPDTDGDGIADIMDKCPNEKGTVENKGCPEIKEETKKIFAQALQGIQFESGKDLIKKSSYPILDKVVTVMKENPAYNLVIEGHTDSQGNDGFNMTLSNKRAEAVKIYLIQKGVDALRLTSQGYGETKPIADNNTATGRYKNRRVEFKVEF